MRIHRPNADGILEALYTGQHSAEEEEKADLVPSDYFLQTV